MKWKDLKHFLILLILVSISIVFGYRVFKEQNFDLFSSDAVSMANWLPVVISTISIGLIIKYRIRNNVLKYVILLWPLLHVIIGLISLSVPILIFFVLSSPLNFFGELIACGYILMNFIQYKSITNKKEIVLMLFSLFVNAAIAVIIIINLSSAHYSSLF